MILLTILFSATCVSATILRDVSQGLVTIVAPEVVLKPQRTTEDRIKEHGHPCETYEVKTQDGYYLTVYRIPRRSDCGEGCGKFPVLLMHGLVGTADHWVIQNQSLAFHLADEGYDVWLGNTRGTTYARKHESLTPANPKFWDFSWHEMGLYDVPDTMKLVLNTTGAEKLVYMGHSQGNTQFWVASTLVPDLYKSVAAMFALAPVTFLEHTTNYFLRAIAQAEPAIFIEESGADLLSDYNPVVKAAKALCLANMPGAYKLCSNILYLTVDINPDNIEKSVLEDFIEVSPAGCSTKQVLHYGQLVRNRNFTLYDYNLFENLKRYGKTSPPLYPIWENRVNVSIFFGDSDKLTASADIETLTKRMSNIVHKYQVPFEGFNHADLLLFKDLKEVLNDHILERLKLV